MPPDIRSFFEGRGGQPASSDKAPTKKQEDDSKTTKKRRSRKVIEDSDDDDFEEKPKKSTPEKPKATKALKAEPQGQPTTSVDYFASNGKAKPARSSPAKSKASSDKHSNGVPNGHAAQTTPKTKAKVAHEVTHDPPSTGRRSSRKTTAKSYAESDGEEESTFLKHEEDDDEDIFVADYKNSRDRGKADDLDKDNVKGDRVTQKLGPSRKPFNGSTTKVEDFVADADDNDDDDVEMRDFDIEKFKAKDRVEDSKPKRGRRPATKAGTKRKSQEFDDDNDDDDDDDDGEDMHDDDTKKRKSKKAAKKPPAKKKKEDRPESKEIQDIFDSIPSIRPPTPPQRDAETKKFNFSTLASRSAPPPGAGTKNVPVGAENCLAGLTFVFTGVLESLGREEGQSLVKRYGGKVTSGPSSKTNYVVLGNEAGPRKLEIIAKLSLKTIDEDGLFDLIQKLPANGGDGKAAEKYEEKKRVEEQKIRDQAAEMEKEEKQRAKALAASAGAASKARSGEDPSALSTNARLWTDKYAPTNVSMICGNRGAVEKLQSWLRMWRYNAKANFKKAGKDGNGIYRAAMIHGPPGIGKTTAAHLVAKLEGYDIVESNASDTRSKKLVEGGLQGVLDTRSLMGYFAGDGKKVEAGKQKLVLIMDEVDGMSAGDRGGVGALAAVAKKTNIPMILICNERKQPKMKPFDNVAFDLPFRRPTAEQIRGRIMTILFREKMKIPSQVVDALVEGTHADIRQVINMISTVKLDEAALDFDRGKHMSKAWEKHVILKPWDIVSKILSAQMFSQGSKATLNDKTELYFNDHEFSFLMLQENYLKTRPMAASNYSGKEHALKLLELADNAAQSISDGDLADRMIHGTQPQWSLMPAHAIFSFVRPASFVYGNMSERPAFSSWLGQNSKYGKLTRFIKEIQGHMRLRASGDRHEIRQQYLPALWKQLVKKLQIEGKESVDDVIDLMDSYFLTKEDWDAILELAVGPMDESTVKIDTQTKATFTRLYNQRSHPLPFMKASTIAVPKKLAKVKPDIEDAIDESDEGEDILAENEAKEDDDEELDLKKDKYVKLPKKAAAKKTAGKQGQGKGKKAGKRGDDEEDDELDDLDGEEDLKPKKGRKGGKTKGKS